VVLADRLAALRSVAAGDADALVRDTRQLLLPLANRLGVWKLKTALEDACMQHDAPAAYAQVPPRSSVGLSFGCGWALGFTTGLPKRSATLTRSLCRCATRCGRCPGATRRRPSAVRWSTRRRRRFAPA
jgi:hypothetical protein